MISLSGNARLLFFQSNVNGDVESVRSGNLKAMLCNSFIWARINVECRVEIKKGIKKMQSIWHKEYLTNNNHTVVPCLDYYITTYFQHSTPYMQIAIFFIYIFLFVRKDDEIAMVTWYLIDLSACEKVFIWIEIDSFGWITSGSKKKKKNISKIWKFIWIFPFHFRFHRMNCTCIEFPFTW